MYVCNCRGFDDDKVQEAVSQHPCASLKEIYKICSKGEKPQCGKCLPEIMHIQAASPCPNKPLVDKRHLNGR